jgi:glycosyltransferase involved in cell wall biosynthesis
MPPRVSLALPVYNGEKFIGDAIRSILAQDHVDFELIITDNASTDHTEIICREFASVDQRVKYFRNETNLGAGKNFNKGLSLASGEYFKWCACDDIIGPNFLHPCVSVLDARQDAVLAYAVTQSIDQEGRLIPLVGWNRPGLEQATPALRFREVVETKGTCFELFGVFRRSALERSMLQPMYYGADHGLLAEMSLFGKFVCVPGIAFYNREHPARSINQTNPRERARFQDTTSKARYSLEHIHHFKHLIEIAFRHRREVPLSATLPTLLRFAARPVQLSRYMLDLLGVVSPSARRLAQTVGMGLLHLIHIHIG